MRFLPLPIVMGMFAGNVLVYVTGVFTTLDHQPRFVGAAIRGYLVSRALGRLWLPPMFGAVLAGLVAAAIGGQINTGALEWSAPTVTAIGPEFHLGSLAALTIPLVVMAIGMGNVQGLGLLAAQGYRPPVAKMTAIMGLTTLINASFGGHVSSIQNNGAAILSGPDAGPREQRYVASVIASAIARARPVRGNGRIAPRLAAARAGSGIGGFGADELDDRCVAEGDEDRPLPGRILRPGHRRLGLDHPGYRSRILGSRRRNGRVGNARATGPDGCVANREPGQDGFPYAARSHLDVKPRRRSGPSPDLSGLTLLRPS